MSGWLRTSKQMSWCFFFALFLLTWPVKKQIILIGCLSSIAVTHQDTSECIGTYFPSESNIFMSSHLIFNQHCMSSFLCTAVVVISDPIADSPPNRFPTVPEHHTRSPPVLSPCGALMGQSELWGSPAQHDPDQWEAASATGRALLPVLTGDLAVPRVLFS